MRRGRSVAAAALLAGAAGGAVAVQRRRAAAGAAPGSGGPVSGPVIGSGAPGGLTPRGRDAAPLPGNPHLPGPAWEPAPLRALAGWVPPPPATPAGRVAACAWAAPLTAVGWLLGLASGATPVRTQGVWVFAEAGGLPAAYLRQRGFVATTLGHVVLARVQPSPDLMAHELAHTRQAERLGVLFGPLYGLLHLVYGYARNPFERAARRAAREAAAARR